jgi:hypothetical protein
MAASQSAQQLVAQSVGLVDLDGVLREVTDFFEAVPLFVASATPMEILCSLGDHDLALVLKLGLVKPGDCCNERVRELWCLARQFRTSSFSTGRVMGQGNEGRVWVVGIATIQFSGVAVSRVQDLYSMVREDPKKVQKPALAALLKEYQTPFPLKEDKDEDED